MSLQTEKLKKKKTFFFLSFAGEPRERKSKRISNSKGMSGCSRPRLAELAVGSACLLLAASIVVLWSGASSPVIFFDSKLWAKEDQSAEVRISYDERQFARSNSALDDEGKNCLFLLVILF